MIDGLMAGNDSEFRVVTLKEIETTITVLRELYASMHEGRSCVNGKLRAESWAMYSRMTVGSMLQ